LQASSEDVDIDNDDSKGALDDKDRADVPILSCDIEDDSINKIIY
jgi:hypothetical protein